MSSQNTLADHGGEAITKFERRWGITRSELERRAANRVMATDKGTERVCDECGKRVTELPDGREAGHKKGQRPADQQCSQFIGGNE